MKKKILVVDDEPDIHTELASFLADEGYETSTASNGEEALRKVKLDRPDLIILDIVMPKMDGTLTHAKLKENPKTKDIPVIFLTGLRAKEDELKGVEVGGYPIFAKPFDFDELLATIREIISGKKI